jgi:hypothetical protein
MHGGGVEPATGWALRQNSRVERAIPSLSGNCVGCCKNMGAAGFEPAAAWSEAKYSVQTELSALETT